MYDVKKLKTFTAAIMQKAGLNADDSKIFADSLINADMRGIGSHGITRLTAYSRRLKEGVVNSTATPEIVRDGGSLLLVDAKNGMGAVTAIRVMDICIERASETGCCFATVFGGNHFGYGAYFTEYAVEHDMIGVSMANAGATMVPIGGRKPVLGTNPLSIAIPAGRYRPMVLDMATSVVAKGKITLAAKEGRTIPKGWGVDANGKPTIIPAEVTAVLPFGGPKGYAIALAIEILCSCLSGALNSQTMGSFYDYAAKQQSGFLLGAINVSKIMNIDEFKSSVDFLLDSIKNSPKADGIQEIFIPGEIEFNNFEKAKTDGIKLSIAVVSELQALSEKYNIPFACELGV